MDALLVANYLTKLKEKTGLTFEAIAEQTGLSLSMVKNLFSGKSEDVSLCEGHQLSARHHVFTAHLSSSVRNFAIVSFMGVYMKNDGRGTRDRLVTCDVS